MISPKDIVKKSGIPAVVLTPHFGLFPSAMANLAMSYNAPILATGGTILAVCLLATDQYLKYTSPSKAEGEVSKSKIERPIPLAPPIKWSAKDPFVLWGQHFQLEDFMTSCLIVGTTGTGKTSAGFDHFLDKMTLMLNDEDDTSDRAKFGGFFLDVKNQFFVRVLYFMARAGRNPLTDLKVISPYAQKLVAEFEDPETGFRFFMNGSHYPTGTACNLFLKGVKRKDGSKYPDNLFCVYDSRYKEMLDELSNQTIPTKGRPLNLIGWRDRGGKMLRVVRNSHLDTLEIYEKDGNQIEIDRPKQLRFVQKHAIDTGLQYNVIDNSLPATAISKQLMKVSKLAEGGGKDGGNDAYWTGSTESQVINCIELWRLIYGRKKQITGADIFKMSTIPDVLDKYLKEVKDQKRVLTNEIISLPEDNLLRRQECEDSLKAIDAVSNYFTANWRAKDPKQRSTVEQMITNLFKIFQTDEHLKRSFCQPATYNFSECMNDGRVFVFVPGVDYSEDAKILGTLLKLHFQKVGLERVDSPTINRNRTVIFGADEVQRYVVALNASEGDADFNNLSRESKVINIVATQTDASISDLIKGAADSYFSSYGIRLYFNVDDPKTKQRAVELCSQTIKKHVYKRKGSDINVTDVMAGKARLQGSTEEKEEKSFKPEDFTTLKKWESVCCNKFAPNYNKPLAVRFKNKPHEYGAPKSGPLIKKLVDWYQTAALEQSLYEQGKSHFVNHDIATRKDAEGSSDQNEESTASSHGAESGGGYSRANPEKDEETPHVKSNAKDPDQIFHDGGSFDDIPDDSDNSYFGSEEEEEEPSASDTTNSPPIPEIKARPRSGVAARLHNGRDPVEKGHSADAFRLFQDDSADKATPSLPFSVKVEPESAKGEPEPSSQEITAGEATEALAAADKESPIARLGRSLESNFEAEELEQHYNEYYIAENLMELDPAQTPFYSPDEITTGKKGFSSDKDKMPVEKGLTAFNPSDFKPGNVESPSASQSRHIKENWEESVTCYNSVTKKDIEL